MSKEQKELFNKMRTCIRDAAMIAKVDYATEVAFSVALNCIKHYTHEFTKIK